MGYQSRDIHAWVEFLPCGDETGSTPFCSGYHPQFHYDGKDWSAMMILIDRHTAFPGETVSAYFTFNSPACHLGNLHAGTTFVLREGSRTIATGRVIAILDLPDSAERTLGTFS